MDFVPRAFPEKNNMISKQQRVSITLFSSRFITPTRIEINTGKGREKTCMLKRFEYVGMARKKNSLVFSVAQIDFFTTVSLSLSLPLSSSLSLSLSLSARALCYPGNETSFRPQRRALPHIYGAKKSSLSLSQAKYLLRRFFFSCMIFFLVSFLSRVLSRLWRAHLCFILSCVLCVNEKTVACAESTKIGAAEITNTSRLSL